MVLAVKVSDTSPFDPVVAVMVVEPLEKVPDAPEVGALKVTLAPGTGSPCESVTLATSGDPKALCTVADCGEPDTSVTEAGAPTTVQQWLEVGETLPALSVAQT